MKNETRVRNFDQGEWGEYVLLADGSYYHSRSLREIQAGPDNFYALPVAERLMLGGPIVFNGKQYVAATGYNVFD